MLGTKQGSSEQLAWDREVFKPEVLSVKVLAMGALLCIQPPWNLGWGCWTVPIPAMPSMLCLSLENGPKQRWCGDNRGVPGVLPEGKATGHSAALLGLRTRSHVHAIIPVWVGNSASQHGLCKPQSSCPVCQSSWTRSMG